VYISAELQEAFEESKTTIACFGDGEMTVADHCLQVATAIHYNKSPTVQLYKRDLVVMAIYHDAWVREGPPGKDGHGEHAFHHLSGRLHPHVTQVLRDHTQMEAAVRLKDLSEFPISIRGLMSFFDKIDRQTTHKNGWPQLPLQFFVEAGYLTFGTSPRPFENWMSLNSTLVWAAPSMWIERTPVLLAQKLGLFESFGLPPVEVRISDGGPELLAMVARGEAHVGEIGLFPFAKYASQTPIEKRACSLVGSTFIQQLDHYLVGPPGSTAGVTALKGKRVGILSDGSCDSYLLTAALNSAGLGKDTVTTVPLGAHYGKTGALMMVDGAFLVEPSLSQAEEQGQASVLIKASTLFPKFQWGALFASNTLQKQEKHLQQILAVYAEACYLMHQAVSGQAPHILDKVLSLGPDCFDVAPEIFQKALLRDIGTWQLSWKNVDYQGADVCVDIMQKLGELEQPLVAKDLFNVPGVDHDSSQGYGHNMSRL